MQTAPWEMIDRYGFPLVRIAARLQGRMPRSARRISARIASSLKTIPFSAEERAGRLTGLSGLECHDREWEMHVAAMIEILKTQGEVEEALRADPEMADLLPLLEPPVPPRWDQDDEPREPAVDL